MSLSLGGSTLLTASIGFLVAAHSQLLSSDASLMAFYGAPFLATIGLIDIAVNWKKSLEEAAKARSETRLNQLKLLQDIANYEKSQAEAPPASRLLSPEDTLALAESYGLSPALGTHIINRCMPTFAQLAKHRPGITVSSESKSFAASAH